MLALQIPGVFIWCIVIHTLKMDSHIIKGSADGSFALVFDTSAFIKALFSEHFTFFVLLLALIALSFVLIKMNQNTLLSLIYTLLCITLILLFARSGGTYSLAEYTLTKGILPASLSPSVKYILLGIQSAVAATLWIVNIIKNKK